MNDNPPKKPSGTATSESQDIELEDQIRLRVYELYEARGQEDGHELGRLVPRKRGDHHQEIPEPPPPDCAHPSQKVKHAPDRSGPFLFTPTLYHQFNRRFEFGGVVSGRMPEPNSSLARAVIPTEAVPCCSHSVLCTEFEMQVRQLQLAPEAYVSARNVLPGHCCAQEHLLA